VGGKKILILGGSIRAVQSALDMADAGNEVCLVEGLPEIDGLGLNLANGPEDTETSARSAWQAANNHKNIRIVRNAFIEKVKKENGRLHVQIKKTAARVIEEKCNDCKACIKVCPIHLWDDAKAGLSLRTAIDSDNPEAGTYNILKERPVCEENCPVHLDIRGYIGLIADGKFKESLALIREKLPFPATIGRICPHPCEEACNRGREDKALCIRDLKRFVADYEGHEPPEATIPIEQKNGKRVAIIGAGPAGLTCAHDLAKLGYGATVFEALPVTGGMLAVGIPSYRLPRNILEKEIDVVKRLGVEIRTNTRIGEDLSLEELFNQGYEAVFIAVGAHKGQKIAIEGEDAKGVVPGVDFLRDLALGKEVQVEKRVAVIGGGNVAMDAARSSLRLGAEEVSILYRRSREEMPASDEEITAALDEGIKIEYLVAPLAVVTRNGKVVGIKCTRMELGDADASGRRRPIPIKGSEFEIVLDMVIPAIGQRSDLSLLSEKNRIEVTKWETIIVDSHTLSTNSARIFAGGDCVTGPGIAIEAVAAGKKAALSIDAYLKGK